MIGKQKKVVLAGAIGSILEWYDFTIYAFFVPIIAKQFFPNEDPFISLLATFGVFAVGFLVRPLGAVLFGYIGDKAGRKKALLISMMMMSFPTVFIGLLPTYDMIGISAPLLLVSLRIIQGLAVSGELTTTTVFLIEHADPHRRGIAGSLAMAGATMGMVLSSIFATTISQLVTESQLALWGFRIPFLVGGLIGIVGFIIRLRTVEPVVFEEVRKHQKKEPLLSAMKNHLSSLSYRKLFQCILLTSMMATSNYFLIAYFNTFLIQNQGLPLRAVMVVNTIALIVQLTMTILMGRLSDFIGRKRVLSIGILSLFVLAYPVFWLLTQHDIYLALLGEVVFAGGVAGLTGVIPTTLAEMYDTYHRNMGISISYNISLALFGGTAPLIAMSLVAMTNSVYAPVWYLMSVAFIALVALFTIKETHQRAGLSSSTESSVYKDKRAFC